MRTVGTAVISSLLPERRYPGAALHDGAELAHRGVASKDVQRLAWRRRAQCPPERGRAIRNDTRAPGVSAGVLKPEHDLLRSGSADSQAPEVRHKLLEVYVPKPGEVFPVDHGIAVRSQNVLFARPLQYLPHRGVVGRRVLDEGEHYTPVASLDLLKPAERRAHASKGPPCLGRLERPRKRERPRAH